MDFIVSILLFTLFFTTFFFIWNYINAQTSEQQSFKTTQSTAVFLSDVLVRTTGNPSNWTNTTAISIGLASEENIINQTKLNELNKTNYDTARTIMGVPQYQVYIYLTNLNNSVLFTYGLNVLSNATLAVPIQRAVLYENITRQPARFNLVLWQ